MSAFLPPDSTCRFFSFDVYVGDAKIALARINFYKGLLLGGIPNYFHPMGFMALRAGPQRCEPLTRLAVRIMMHMKSHNLAVVSVPRRDIECRPGITPNYVIRTLATIPRLEGTTNLPSIDNIFCTRFRAAAYHFS